MGCTALVAAGPDFPCPPLKPQEDGGGEWRQQDLPRLPPQGFWQVQGGEQGPSLHAWPGLRSQQLKEGGHVV